MTSYAPEVSSLAAFRPISALPMVALLVLSVAGSSADAQGRRRGRRAPVQGTLQVVGEPSGAEVYIDGERVGVLPLEAPIPLPPGSHAVRVMSPGFTEFNEVVDVRSGRTSTVSAELLAISMSLLVLTTPEGAQVFVDGEFAGESPATLDLRQGTRSVRIRQFGYHDSVFEVEAIAGAADTREVQLEPLPPELRAELLEAPTEWYEEPLPWALIGGGVAIVAATVVTIVLITSEGPLEQEEFCAGGGFPCAVFEF